VPDVEVLLGACKAGRFYTLKAHSRHTRAHIGTHWHTDTHWHTWGTHGYHTDTSTQAGTQAHRDPCTREQISGC